MTNTPNKPIIAIDGHSSCGKSTFAKQIAQRLNYTYIDSGAMYRAFTLFLIRNELIIHNKINENQLGIWLDRVAISFRHNPETNRSETTLNDENVEDEIRNSAIVAQHVSMVSTYRKIRKKLVDIQREIGKEGQVVMDGRDIGTVVFPDAGLKIFMTASVEVRAQRRHKELTEKGIAISLEAIKENLEHRDQVDQGRAESPLRKAEDALLLDNSNMTMEEQLDWVMPIIRERMG